MVATNTPPAANNTTVETLFPDDPDDPDDPDGTGDPDDSA
jgi:hypothetical protein